MSVAFSFCFPVQGGFFVLDTRGQVVHTVVSTEGNSSNAVNFRFVCGL